MEDNKLNSNEYLKKEDLYPVLRLIASFILLGNAFLLFKSTIGTVLGGFILISTVIGIYAYMYGLSINNKEDNKIDNLKINE